MNTLKTKAKISADNSMDLSVSMYRLFMQDTQKTNLGTDLVTKEFQYLICNPKIESLQAKELSDQDFGQLELKLLTNGKENTTNLNILFTDFRITIVFLTIKAVLIFISSMQKLGDNVMLKLQAMQAAMPKSEQKVEQKPAPQAPKKAPKGKTDLIAKISNIEAWLPEDATREKTTVTKFGFSGDANVVNDVSENGEIVRSVNAKLNGVSAVYAEPEKIQEMLRKFDIGLEYNESVGIMRDIKVGIMPIKILVTLRQLLFFQSLANKLNSEIQHLDLVQPAKIPPAAPAPAPAQAPELTAEQKISQFKESINTKMRLDAKLDLVEFTLKDDIAKYPYPLLSFKAIDLATNIMLDPMKGKHVSAHLFEIGMELGRMFNEDAENKQLYMEYFSQLPIYEIQKREGNSIEIYKEIL